MNLRIKSIIIISINRSNNDCNRINTSNGNSKQYPLMVKYHQYRM